MLHMIQTPPEKKHLTLQLSLELLSTMRTEKERTTLLSKQKWLPQKQHNISKAQCTTMQCITCFGNNQNCFGNNTSPKKEIHLIHLNL